MIYLGDYAVGATVAFNWNAFSGLGGSITRATDGAIRIYKGNSITQRSSAAGITDSEDFDALTGLNHVQIDLADNTDAGFYAAGSDYSVVLQGAVIDGQTVNAVLAHFSIARATAFLGTPAGASLAADIAAIKAVLPTALVSGRVDASVGAMATNAITASAIAASSLNGKGDWNVGKTGYALSTAGVQAIWDALSSALTTVGSIGKRLVDDLTGDIYARLGAPAGASVSVDVAAVKAVLPAALVGGRIDASIGAVATGAIAAASFAANALDAVWSTAVRLLTAGTNIVLVKDVGVTGFTDLSAAQVNAEADTALADVGVTTTVTGRIDAAVTSRLATAGYTSPPTANDNADALLDRTAGVETNRTLRQGLRLMLAALAGKASGLAGTTATYRDTNDGVDRIVATVDVDGNRSAVTLDAS